MKAAHSAAVRLKPASALVTFTLHLRLRASNRSGPMDLSEHFSFSSKDRNGVDMSKII